MTENEKKDVAMTPAEMIFNPAGNKYSDNSRIWQGIPSIEKTKGGRLWVAFYGGGKREGKGNYVVLVKSEDDGNTWSKPYMIIDHKSPDVRSFDPCLWIDPSGRLWFFFTQGKNNYDGRLGVWAAVCINPDAKEPKWEKPRRCANGIMIKKPTVLSSGEWLLPCALWICDERHEEHGLSHEMFSNVYISKDEGKTFYLLGGADIPDRHYDEHSVIELEDGRLWMLVRTHYGVGQSFSSDGGKTWSPGTETDFGGPSSKFFVTRLNSGKLLMVNHYNFIKRNNLYAMLSDDEGKTWKGHLLLDGRDSVTYPDGVQDKDGTVYVVYDRERGKEREILMCAFTEEDVLAGRFISDKARQRVIVNKGRKE